MPGAHAISPGLGPAPGSKYLPRNARTYFSVMDSDHRYICNAAAAAAAVAEPGRHDKLLDIATFRWQSQQRWQPPSSNGRVLQPKFNSTQTMADDDDDDRHYSRWARTRECFNIQQRVRVCVCLPC